MAKRRQTISGPRGMHPLRGAYTDEDRRIWDLALRLPTSLPRTERNIAALARWHAVCERLPMDEAMEWARRHCG